MNIIDYKTLLDNVDKMINLLEYDAMRGSGKAKLNCGHLESLYNLHDRYTAKLAAAPKKAANNKVADVAAD